MGVCSETTEGSVIEALMEGFILVDGLEISAKALILSGDNLKDGEYIFLTLTV